MSIAQVSIRAVRGIRHEVALELDGKSWLIHGDNGTGKSSIERALRWALLGTEVPASGKPLSSEESCRRHVLEGEESPRVVIRLSKTGQIEVGGDGLDADEAGLAFRTACSQGNPFLRRLELLDFLNARPADRFRYLDSYLDLTVIDTTLNDLSDKEKQVAKRIKASRQSLEAMLLNLAHRLPEQFRPKKTTSNGVMDSLFKLGKHLGLTDGEAIDWKSLETLGNTAQDLSTGSGLDDKRRSLTTAEEAVRRLGERVQPLPSADMIALAKRRQQMEQSTASPTLASLLEHARKHIDLEEGEFCPICGQQVERTELLQKIDTQLSELEEYRSLSSEMKQFAKTWQLAWREFVEAQGVICSSCGLDSLTAIDDVRDPPGGSELLKNLLDSDEKFQTALLVVGPNELLNWLKATTRTAATFIEQEIGNLPAADTIGDVRILDDVIKALIDKRTSIESLERDISLDEKKQALVRPVYQAMRKARQDVAQEVLDEIATLVAGYYARIHPPGEECEVTRAPTIEVQRHAGGTAFVRGEFAEKLVKDPKWVYSDGHLDTVGICIFLALRRYRSKNPSDSKLMVLDDVVLSIDLGHARRLIQLLRDDFDDHQILIFTHNGLFARWCLNLMPGLKKLAVSGWSLETGPHLSDYATTVDRLANHISDSSPKEIAMNMMWLMDEWLAEARFSYSLSVPAKYGDEYTLTEIWDPFCSAMRKLVKLFGDELLNVNTLLDELRDLPHIRNMLAAHENEFAQEFPRNVMAEIASHSIMLVKTLYCLDCHTFALPIPTRHAPQVLACRCEELRYVRPSKSQKRKASGGEKAKSS